MADKKTLRARVFGFIFANLDGIIGALKLLIPSTAVGVIVGWSIWFTGLFQASAPASWIIAGLLAWFLTVVGIALLAFARGRNQLTRFREGVFDNTRINPLAPRFTTERIRMVDLAPPVGGTIANKVFDDCEIIGPANVMFSQCHFQGTGGDVVDALIVKTGIFPRNGFGFSNCTFIKCRFYLITFMVPEPEYPAFAFWNWRGLNWLTDLPSEDSNAVPTSNSGAN